MRDLFALPARLGGLGVVNPVQDSDRYYQASVTMSAPPVAYIVRQDPHYFLEVYYEQLDSCKTNRGLPVR